MRWPEFQHYRPDPDRPPAFIKDYPKQMDDERYLRLTDRQRALIRDLRDVFAIARGRLRYDQRMIGARRNIRTRHADLEALNHAGLIEVCSREVLEQRLEKLYSRARPRAREEVEVEVDPPIVPQHRNSNGAVCPECGTGFRGPQSLAEHLYVSHQGPEPKHWRVAEERAAE